MLHTAHDSRADPARNRDKGGGHDCALICDNAHFPMSLCCSCLSATTRPDRAGLAENGRTGAPPPYLPLVRHAWGWFVPGFVPKPKPPFGVAPVQNYPCGKAVAGRLAVSRDGRGRTATLGVGTARTKDGDTAVPGRLSRPPSRQKFNPVLCHVLACFLTRFIASQRRG